MSPTTHLFVARLGDFLHCSECGELPTHQTHGDWLEALGPAAYHRWYYNQNAWRHVSFMGVYCAKNVLDLWNYQEIIWDIKPGLIVEFGTYAGGSALYFAWLMKALYPHIQSRPLVLTVDHDHRPLSRDVINDPTIFAFYADTTGRECAVAIRHWSAIQPKFFCLDSDHRMEHVLAELELLRDLTRPGDYVVVEDGNINGHPVLPDFGPGPMEAIEEYERRHPDDYEHDTEREMKFGFTFAPKGYLRRK